MTEAITFSKPIPNQNEFDQDENLQADILLENLNVKLTPAALKQFSSATEEEGTKIIRLIVRGGGCSGFQQLLNFIEEKEIDQEEDLIEQINGITFVMDVFSKQYLQNTTIDYVSNLNQSGFKFDNPSSKRVCGCRQFLLGLVI